MKLIIDITEEDFEIIKHNVAVNNPLCPINQKDMVIKIANGTQPKAGHWNKDFMCSICGCICYPMDIDFGDYNYCPNCGARMVDINEEGGI